MDISCMSAASNTRKERLLPAKRSPLKSLHLQAMEICREAGNLMMLISRKTDRNRQKNRMAINWNIPRTDDYYTDMPIAAYLFFFE